LVSYQFLGYGTSINDISNSITSVKSDLSVSDALKSCIQINHHKKKKKRRTYINKHNSLKMSKKVQIM